MNDDDGPDLQRLFAGYEPTITAEPFLDQALAALHREIRRAQVASAIRYVLSALLIVGLVAVTAAPLTRFMHALETNLEGIARGLSPAMVQVLVYAATLGSIALARRRLAAFLAPW